MIKSTLYLLTLMLIFISCQKDEESSSSLDQDLKALLMAASQGQGLDFFVLPESNDFDRIPQDPNNPLTVEKVELGQHLYHETCSGSIANQPRYSWVIRVH